MTRNEFYDNLRCYRNNSLMHQGMYGPPSGTNKYYAKLDNYYKDGSPRYFYSKAEYDAYQKNKSYDQNAEKDKQNRQKNNMDKEQLKQKRAKAAKQTISDREAAIKKTEESAKAREKKRKENKENFDKETKNIILNTIDEITKMENNSFSDSFYKMFDLDTNDKKYEALKKTEIHKTDFGLILKILDSHWQDYTLKKAIIRNIENNSKFKELLESDGINPIYKKKLERTIKKFLKEEQSKR